MPFSSRKEKSSSSSKKKDSSPLLSSSSSSSPSSSRSATRRLLKELETWRAEQDEEGGIERLGPVSDEDLMTWEAVMNGRGIGHGYDAGRWLLSIQIPEQYPLKPPRIRFATPVVHANVALRGGDICLDLLNAGAGTGPGAGTGTAWSPAYSVLECVRAVRLLLALPETDSPLNLDVAALLRAGDTLAARRLVEMACAEDEGRYDGV